MPLSSTILGIESSCDDTAAAILVNGKIQSNVTNTQDIHRKYGGVVPELASRAHQSNIIPVISEALAQSNTTLQHLDAIAVTQGPGLMGSLIVGVNVAKGLSMSLGIPLLGVNHLQAHVAALYLENSVQFPLLCLLVSGGHTQLIFLKNELDFTVIGETIDDAVGEAFDKAGKILGLGYPGGPQIAKIATTGDPKRFKFPDSQTGHLDFSFSGIKTSLLYFLRKESNENSAFIEENLDSICASYQQSLIDMLLKRFNSAIIQFKPNSIGIVGGVSANALLRNSVMELGQIFDAPVYIPKFEYCTDNAAMIAKAGELLLEKGKTMKLSDTPYSRNEYL